MRGNTRSERPMWVSSEEPVIEDYRIISSTDPQEVEKEVKDKLQQGWMLHGELTYSRRHEIYTQAMYKPSTEIA